MVIISASTLRYKLLLNSRFLHHRFNVDAQIIRGTGWPTCRVGRPRCKEVVRDATNHSCFHSFGRHAKRRADMQGWPPEMQKKNLHLGRPTLHVGPPILLSYYFTIYYFTPDTVLPRPMFGVGRPRCKKFSTYYHAPPRTATYYSRT